ncbi:unnamed protein product [Durusdinium trenchii]|uniref:Uncharacterized protein n=1 Tax=Durusdinium trenchii TaxID=1381693 RepID=A0ABP0JQ92_9DINO
MTSVDENTIPCYNVKGERLHDLPRHAESQREALVAAEIKKPEWQIVLVTNHHEIAKPNSIVPLEATYLCALISTHHELSRAVSEKDVPRVEQLLEEGHDPNCRDPTGKPVWLQCVDFEIGQCVKSSLEARASPDAKDLHGRTSLLKASEWSCWELAQVLLDAKASPNISDSQGKTPLQLAAENEHSLLVALLLQAGAS